MWPVSILVVPTSHTLHPFSPAAYFLVKIYNIMGEKQTKRIVLGLTGGIAAYKAAELARLLVKKNIDIQVVMTEAACHFITPVTMQALTGHPVLVNQWDVTENGMPHICTSRVADAIVIVPATADFIAKLAHGLADDLLSTMCLARDCMLLIAPAMNKQMWESAATQRNVRQLKADGVLVLGPDNGIQACGEEGLGRMLEADVLARDVEALLNADIAQKTNSSIPNFTHKGERRQDRRMNGAKIVITAGPTYEAIDTVRGITNRSSGKMGYAIAQAAIEQGAQVTLISGPTSLVKPLGAQCVDVTSAEQMFDAVKQNLPGCDVFIGVAAVSDYRVAQSSKKKIKRSTDNLSLELIPNPDILAYVASQQNPPFCVGFAAESENLAEFAEQKRREKKLPLLVGNLVQNAIGSDDNELVLFDDSGRQTLPRADKLTLARQLIQRIAQRKKGAIR